MVRFWWGAVCGMSSTTLVLFVASGTAQEMIGELGWLLAVVFPLADEVVDRRRDEKKRKEKKKRP